MIPKDSMVATLSDFQLWFANAGLTVAHIKGFGKGIGSYYDEEAIKELGSYDAIAFDGDPYEEDGFTALIPKFLALAGRRIVIAFKTWEDIVEMQSSYTNLKVLHRMIIVRVNIEKAMETITGENSSLGDMPQWAQQYYALGRVAIKATGSMFVLCLGGGSIAQNEAEANIKAGGSWVVFALSRGEKERFPSVMDWAQKNHGHNVQFVRGKDPHEQDGFATLAESTMSSRPQLQESIM